MKRKENRRKQRKKGESCINCKHNNDEPLCDNVYGLEGKTVEITEKYWCRNYE